MKFTIFLCSLIYAIYCVFQDSSECRAVPDDIKASLQEANKGTSATMNSSLFVLSSEPTAPGCVYYCKMKGVQLSGKKEYDYSIL